MKVTIAKFQALPTSNTGAVDVIVSEIAVAGWPPTFTVHVAGGLLSEGTDEYKTSDLRVALIYAAQEVAAALGN